MAPTVIEQNRSRKLRRHGLPKLPVHGKRMNEYGTWRGGAPIVEPIADAGPVTGLGGAFRTRGGRQGGSHGMSPMWMERLAYRIRG